VRTRPAYDCAKILIDASAAPIDTAGGNMPNRKAGARGGPEDRQLKLSTGTYSFDKLGDPTAATMASTSTRVVTGRREAVRVGQ